MRTAIRTLAAAAVLCAAGAGHAQGKGEADGERVVGKWGAAYFGTTSFDFGAPALADPVDVHFLGVRRWLPGATPGTVKGIGFEAGVGIGWVDHKVKTPIPGGTLTTEASGFGLGLHAGLPLALARVRHLTFLAIPEANLVYASGSNDQPGPTSTDWSGWAFDLGARIGFELHFGFIDVPELALQGTLGAAFRYAESTAKQGGAETTFSRWTLGTERPADLFTGKVAVVYYF